MDISVQKGAQLLSSASPDITRMKFNKTLVNFVLLVTTVTVRMILVISQAMSAPMGFIAPMEQGLPLSLVVQMEHMVMVPSFSVQISVSNAHLENSAMVRIPINNVQCS